MRYNLRYKVPKEIPVVIYNVSTYDYHFIIKLLAEEFEVQFKCLWENTKKHITFSVRIIKGEKEKDDNGKKKMIGVKKRKLSCTK